MNNHYVLGIDLGTTNSCVAVMEGGHPVIIENKSGYKTTPSVVAITENGKRLVGQLAKRQSVTNPKNTVFATKRFIGRSWKSLEVEELITSMPFEVRQGPNDDARIVLREKVYSLPEVSSMILCELRNVAEQYLKSEVNEAIITVPAYFNDVQRQATIDAGRIAGLEVLRIINEPTAAALAYGYKRSEDATIAVYDLGGGTFDISVLRIEDGVFSVLSTAGDTFLGGEDFDNRIIDHLIYAFSKENGVDLRTLPMAMQRLKIAAEKAKCELSTISTTTVELPFIWTDEKGEAVHLNIEITRDLLESLTADLIGKTMKIVALAIEDAGMAVSDVDDVLLIGGMTRMPMVQDAVATFFSKKPSKAVHPDEAVAIGAAIQADALACGNQDFLLLDVTPLDLGIAIHGGGFHVIIPKNTTIPTTHSTVFTTSVDGQTSLKIIVMQGAGKKASDNRLLSEFLFSGIRPGPAGAADIEISFHISADGLVSVSAKDLETNAMHRTTIERSSHLSQEEIRAMIEENRNTLLKQKNEEETEMLRARLSALIRELRLLASTKDLAENMMLIVNENLFSAQQSISSSVLSEIETASNNIKQCIDRVKPL